MQILFENHALIHSMSRSEKRYVSLVGGSLAGGKKSSLLRLFAVINADPEYKEEELLQDKVFLGCGKGLPTQLHRLRSLLLKALVFQHNGKNQAFSALDTLRNVELLFQRGLPEASLRLIRQKLLTVIQFGEYEAALSLLNWETRIKQMNYEAYGHMEIQAELAANGQDAEFLRNCISHLAKLREMHWQIRQLIQLAPRAREASLDAQLEEIGQHPFVAGMRESREMLLRAYAVDIYGMYLLIKGRNETALAQYKTLIQDWDAHPEMQQKYADLYLLIFKNYQNAIVFGAEKRSVLNEYLGRLAQPGYLTGQARLDYQRIRYQHILTVGLNSGNFEIVRAHADEIRSWVMQHQKTLSTSAILTFLYNMTMTWFLSGDFARAYTELRGIIEWEHSHIRVDIRIYARVLQLILLYELGHHDLNEYLGRSTDRYLRKNQHRWPFELSVARYIQKSLKQGPGKHQEAALTSLQKELEAHQQDAAQGYPVTGLSETLIWINSKLAQRSIREEFLALVDAQFLAE